MNVLSGNVTREDLVTENEETIRDTSVESTNATIMGEGKDVERETLVQK